MEHGVSAGDYKDLLLFLATAGIIAPLLQRFRISPILGFLAAGVALGPFGLGSLADTYPWLGYVTVSRAGEIGPARRVRRRLPAVHHRPGAVVGAAAAHAPAGVRPGRPAGESLRRRDRSMCMGARAAAARRRGDRRWPGAVLHRRQPAGAGGEPSAARARRPRRLLGAAVPGPVGCADSDRAGPTGSRRRSAQRRISPDAGACGSGAGADRAGRTTGAAPDDALRGPGP